jgi:hypothetical protein
MTTKDLARKLGMSEFFVSSELGKREKDTDQIDIFERNS